MSRFGLGGSNPLHRFGLGVATHFWRDDVFREQEFGVYHIDADLRFENVVYVFVQNLMGQCRPIYWGMAQNMADRFVNHHKIDAARRDGANEIHVLHLHPNTSREDRNALEMSFLRAYPTRLNETGNVYRDLAETLATTMGQCPSPPPYYSSAFAAFLQSPPQQAGFAKSPPPFPGLVPGSESYRLYRRGRSSLDDLV